MPRLQREEGQQDSTAAWLDAEAAPPRALPPPIAVTPPFGARLRANLYLAGTCMHEHLHDLRECMSV